MAIKGIPESWVYICDACRAESAEKTKVRFPKYWSILTVSQDSYDYQGCAVADGAVTRLLCMECTELVTKAINEAVNAREPAVE